MEYIIQNQFNQQNDNIINYFFNKQANLNKTNVKKILVKTIRTKELCELAVTQNGNALQYVPKELRTQELCEIAVEQNGLTLKYVPDFFTNKRVV